MNYPSAVDFVLFLFASRLFAPPLDNRHREREKKKTPPTLLFRDVTPNYTLGEKY